jgi:hypothetical protein
VIRLIDLLAVAVDDMRQGGDPRLPLELALVKVTRAASDLSRESTAFRLERLEQAAARTGAPPPSPEAATRERPMPAAPVSQEEPSPPDVGLSQLQEAWTRTIVPAVAERSIPISTVLGEARPAELEGDTLTVEFPANASFHRQLAEEPKNATMLREALYEVTGRKLALAFAVGDAEDGDDDVQDEGPAGEEKFLELMKETFDARERESE